MRKVLEIWLTSARDSILLEESMLLKLDSISLLLKIKNVLNSVVFSLFV